MVAFSLEVTWRFWPLGEEEEKTSTLVSFQTKTTIHFVKVANRVLILPAFMTHIYQKTIIQNKGVN